MSASDQRAKKLFGTLRRPSDNGGEQSVPRAKLTDHDRQRHNPPGAGAKHQLDPARALFLQQSGPRGLI